LYHTKIAIANRRGSADPVEERLVWRRPPGESTPSALLPPPEQIAKITEYTKGTN
jgi:hypothetical protein